MDVLIETAFVQRCIKKEYQERLLFTLQSPKRRQKAFSRFAHDCETILQKGYRKLSASAFMDELTSYSQKEQCYLIGDHLQDTQTMPLAEAVELCQSSYMPIILVSPSFVLIKPEVEGKSPDLYFYANRM